MYKSLQTLCLDPNILLEIFIKAELYMGDYRGYVQGVHQILCFFEDIQIYFGLWPLSVSPLCQCAYTMAGQTPALQYNWQISEKSQ